jgi:hypothetical protein
MLRWKLQFEEKQPAAAKEAAEKGELDRVEWPNGIPQGLEPIHFNGLIGTTEVVPCYKAA